MCLYLSEVASIGLNIETAKSQNIKATSYKVPFNAIGKAVIEETKINVVL